MPKAIICFLNQIHLFDSVHDFYAVTSTEDAFEYKDSNKLSEKIIEITSILHKYGNRPDFFLKDQIIHWLKSAFLRFGIKMEKFSQPGISKFQDLAPILNSFGFILK